MKGVIYITKKNPIWDLKIGGGMGVGEVVNGRAVLGDDDCMCPKLKLTLLALPYTVVTTFCNTWLSGMS